MFIMKIYIFNDSSNDNNYTLTVLIFSNMYLVKVENIWLLRSENNTYFGTEGVASSIFNVSPILLNFTGSLKAP